MGRKKRGDEIAALEAELQALENAPEEAEEEVYTYKNASPHPKEDPAKATYTSRTGTTNKGKTRRRHSTKLAPRVYVTYTCEECGVEFERDIPRFGGRLCGTNCLEIVWERLEEENKALREQVEGAGVITTLQEEKRTLLQYVDYLGERVETMQSADTSAVKKAWKELTGFFTRWKEQR